ncbi:MAG: 4Fe-4S dicluster domain-containing protein [Planctomycetota bacterium]
MISKVIKRDDFLGLVDELPRRRSVIGPVSRQERFFYEEVDRAEQIDLSFNYCVYGPRAFLFPPTESLFTFTGAGSHFSASPTIEARPQAFIGVHPCDINAIRLLDHIFSVDHPDEHYLARRRQTLIVGVDCAKPCTEGIFCADMETNEAAEGFDVMLVPFENGEERFGVALGTTAGREWLIESRLCTDLTAADKAALKQYADAKKAAFTRQLKTRADELPSLLDRSYDSLLWEATARRCYSCGSCNLSCPTCYCFNMFDEVDLTLTAGARKREWDGCHLDKFATVAGDHNFRAKAASRLRHRIYRKAKWVRELSGMAGCVGCARCDRACTAKINSVEIYNQLAEEV